MTLRKSKVKGDPRIIVDCLTVEELMFGSRHDPEKTFGRRKNRKTRALDVGKEWRSVDMESDDERARTNSGPGDSTEEDAYTDEDEGKGGVAIDLGQADQAHDSGNDVPAKSQDLNPLTHGDRIRPAQLRSEVNGSVGGEKGWAERQEEAPAMVEKRREGQRKAEEREMVRRAARRLCAFGVPVKDEKPKHDKEGPKKRGKKGDRADGEEEERRERRRKCETIWNGIAVEASYAKGEKWGIRWREE